MYFATLIENLPALIEKSPKIFKPKLKISKDFQSLIKRLVFVSVSTITWTQAMYSKETFSRDAAHIIDLHLNILSPVPDVFNCITYEKQVGCF